MQLYHFTTISLIFIRCCPSILSGMTSEKDLDYQYENYSNYSKFVRAIFDSADRNPSYRIHDYLPERLRAINVTFYLYNIVDVKLHQQEILINVGLLFSYYDMRLPKLYRSISNRTGMPIQWKVMKLYSTSYPKPDLFPIWIPHFNVQQASQAPKGLIDASYVLWLEPSGRAAVQVYTSLSLRCNFDVSKFPFDTQECNVSFVCINCERRQIQALSSDLTDEVKFGPDLSSGSKIRAYISGAYGEEHGVYGNTFFNVEYLKPQIESSFSGGLYMAVITMSLKRLSHTLVFSIILPAILIQLQSLVQFIIPVDRSDKLGIAITCLLGNTFLSLKLEDHVGNDDEQRVPLIIIFFNGLTITQVFGAFMSAMVIRIHNYGEQLKVDNPDEKLVRTAILIARILCMKKSLLPLKKYLKKTCKTYKCRSSKEVMEFKKMNGRRKESPDINLQVIPLNSIAEIDEKHLNYRHNHDDVKQLLVNECWFELSRVFNRISAILCLSSSIFLTSLIFIEHYLHSKH